MVAVQGMCATKFEAVREAFEKNFEKGLEVGASVAVAVEGELVVDLWAGVADEEQGRPWERDTITNTWSTTKTMAVLSALLLVDRGALELDAPVARYWPEFAAAGKDGVLVRHVLSHTSGLAGWEKALRPTDFGDFEKMTSLLAAQAPWWTPGDGSGYHGFTHGFLIGELVRRVTGQTLPDFFRRELAEPLGADFQIVVSEADYSRISPNIAPPPRVEAHYGFDDENSIAVRALKNPGIGGDDANTDWWRRAEVGAAGGHGNARSVALVQRVLSSAGEIGGRRFLSRKTCEAVLSLQADNVDRVTGRHIKWGVGFALRSPGLPLPVNDSTYYWGGWGGSFVTNDLSSNMTVAYVMNRMQNVTVGDERGVALFKAAEQSLAGTV
ncbi:serine hydrolase domain-containing protein [Arthrobacter sp. B6]|uniref:serine hydrolase domain-containing protein n=1 Tax=Arthrobacter sp. B6 TaxID=1570137 RepID=UPI000B3388DB|nr:serine hydrolase domain-containing protein [Arthrobacter sp. B6]